MAIEWMLDEKKRFGRADIYIGYLRDGTVVKKAQITLAHGISPTADDVQAAWNSGTPVPGGAKLWNQIQMRDTDDLNRDAINAIFDVLRANGTMAQMITDAEAVIATSTRQNALYTRLTTALNGATAAQRWQFLAILATVSFSKIGQR
jgi:hypothetical protein